MAKEIKVAKSMGKGIEIAGVFGVPEGGEVGEFAWVKVCGGTVAVVTAAEAVGVGVGIGCGVRVGYGYGFGTRVGIGTGTGVSTVNTEIVCGNSTLVKV